MRPIRIYNDELLEGANGLPAIAGMIRHVIEHFDQYLHMVDPLTHTVVVPVFDADAELHLALSGREPSLTIVDLISYHEGGMPDPESDW